MEAVIRATEHNRALPPTQTGARVYCPKRGFTREKKADKLRLRALSGGDSQSALIPQRVAEAALEEAAEFAGGGVAQLLGDRLHGEHPALQQWQAYFSPHIIDKIRKTTGQPRSKRRCRVSLSQLSLAADWVRSQVPVGKCPRIQLQVSFFSNVTLASSPYRSRSAISSGDSWSCRFKGWRCVRQARERARSSRSAAGLRHTALSEGSGWLQ